MNLLLRFFSFVFPPRMFKPDKELYEFGEFRLDVDERKLVRCDGGTSGSLPEKAFQTLVHLVRNHGKLVKKEELLASVWPDTIVEENNLGKAIHSIRQLLGDSSANPQYVETVPKHGYRFVAEVERIVVSRPSVTTLTASGAHVILRPEEHQDRDPSSPRPDDELVAGFSTPLRTRNLWVVYGAALSIAVLAVIFGWAIWTGTRVDVQNSPFASVETSEHDSQRAAYDRYVRG